MNDSPDRVTNWQLVIKDLKDDQTMADAETAKAVFELIEQRQQERWAAEDAKWHKYNTEFNRQQMEDSCEGESP